MNINVARPEICSLIAGQEHAGSRSADVMNPSTGGKVAKLRFADDRIVSEAVARAQAAFETWRNTTPISRARILMKFRDLVEANKGTLAELITLEQGKPIPDALGSIQRGIEVVEFAIGGPQLLKGEYSPNVANGVATVSSRRPIGVCVGITPFNYPAMIPMWMFPLALACGNTFILKPSEKTPSAANFLAALLAEANLPPGVFNVVHGDRETAQSLLTHKDVAAVSFVGSSRAAADVYRIASSSGKRVQALGGAKNHAIVMPDADIDLAVSGVINGAFNSAGQRCMATAVVVMVGDVAGRFLPKLRAAAERMVVASGSVVGCEVPPLATAEGFSRVNGYIEGGISEGAELLLDGRNPEVPTANKDGYFVGPTIFDKATTRMRIYQEEIFGPVLVILRVPELGDAIRISNEHALGNGATLYTASGKSAQYFQQEILCGMPGVNVPVPSPVAYYSFGGSRSSLYGDLAAHGPDAVNFYTRRQVLTSRWD